MTKTLIVLSGGLDSTTLLKRQLTAGHNCSAVSFNYGQRHKKELEYAAKTCDLYGIKHTIIDLWSAGLTTALSVSGSSLVSDTEVPEGHYAQDNMKATVVPNRNMIMLSIAAGIAIANGDDYVATAVHAGDHFIYPDCRPSFIKALQHAITMGNEGFNPPQLLTPYIYATKEDIAYEAIALGVRLSATWSCYKGGSIHCGKCGTCVERIEAIHGAQQRWMSECADRMPYLDSTEYEDTEYWKTQVEA